MPTKIATRKYAPPRETRKVPFVSLRALRQVAGWTLEELAERIQAHVPELTVSRGTLSAIESGSRGASALMIQALEQAYGLETGSISTEYRPRRSPLQDSENSPAAHG